MSPPVANAIKIDAPRAINRITGSTGNFTGWPPTKIVCEAGKVASCVFLRIRNDP